MVDLLDTKTIATLSFCNNTSSPITVKVYLFHVDENGSYGAGSTDEGHMVDVVVPANGFYDLTPLVGGLTLNTDELLVVQPSATGVISTCSYVRVSHTDALPD
jgi:hypothetical protein